MSLICGSQIIESNDFFSKLAVIKKTDEQVDLNLVFSSFKFSKFCHILFTKLLVRNDIILSVITDLSEYDIFKELLFKHFYLYFAYCFTLEETADLPALLEIYAKKETFLSTIQCNEELQIADFFEKRVLKKCYTVDYYNSSTLSKILSNLDKFNNGDIVGVIIKLRDIVEHCNTNLRNKWDSYHKNLVKILIYSQCI